METAGLAGAAVVTATMGPGATATASTGDRARGAGPVTAASAGAAGAGLGGELGAQSALHGRWALVTRAPALPPQVPNTPETPLAPVRPARWPPPARSTHQGCPSLRPPQAPTCSGVPPQPTPFYGPCGLEPLPGQP